MGRVFSYKNVIFIAKKNFLSKLKEMDRRKFIKKTGQALLVVSSISITGSLVSSCSSDDDNSFNDGYYGDGYYDDGYYDDGYYDDGYYDDGYYDDGYYDDGYSG